MEKLDELRDKIDSIDEKLLHLLSSRFEIIREIGELKKKKNMEVLQSDRWNSLLEKLIQKGKELNIPPGCIENIWNEIHERALKLENNI